MEGSTAQDAFHQQAVLLRPFPQTAVADDRGLDAVSLPVVSHPELGPRPPFRPQPEWLLRARRLLLTSTTRTELEHTDPTLEPQPKCTFAHLGAAEGFPSLAVSSTSPKPKSREDTNRGAARTGRGPTSQRARSGTEAHSKELVHPVVTATFLADLESPPELGSGQGPPPDPSRERLQSLREPRCFLLIGSLAGELIPRDRLTRNRLSDGARARLLPGTESPH